MYLIQGIVQKQSECISCLTLILNIYLKEIMEDEVMKKRRNFYGI